MLYRYNNSRRECGDCGVPLFDHEHVVCSICEENELEGDLEEEEYGEDLD